MIYENDTDETFQGACLDSGAQQSVIGFNEPKAFYIETKYGIVIQSHQKAFRIGDGKFQGIGFLNTNTNPKQHIFILQN